MKRILLVALMLVLVLPAIGAKAQTNNFEVKEYENGLIYPDSTLKYLANTVDSLNQIFKLSGLPKEYTALPQTVAYVVRLEKGCCAKQAFDDMVKGISFDAFLKKYPDATYQKTLVVRYLGFENSRVSGIIYSQKGAGDNTYQIEEKDLSKHNKDISNSWAAEFISGNDVNKDYVIAFYFPEDFKTAVLPMKYRRMIQYADLMIDTSVEMIYESAMDKPVINSFSNDKGNSITRFLRYIETETNAPDRKLLEDEKTSKEYWRLYSEWEDSKDSIIEAKLAHKAIFQKHLKEAVDFALRDSLGSIELERYAQKYILSKDLLQLKRQRFIGYVCGFSSAPFLQASEIAQLAAQTRTWNVFLRAHLHAIINDFNGRIDTNIWHERSTFIKELEAIHLDVAKLIFGITIDMENPSGSHFFAAMADIRQLISTCEKAKEMEAMMAEAIADTSLDVYNRFMFYFLFRNYAYHIEDEMQKKAVAEIIDKAANTLPDYIVADIKKRKE